MRATCVWSVVFVTMAATAPPAWAQVANDADLRRMAGKILTASKIVPLTRVGGDGSASPEPKVELLAGTEGTAARARIGILVTNVVSLDLSVTGPLSNGSATLLTHDGLAGEVSASGAFRLFFGARYRAGDSSTAAAMQLLQPAFNRDPRAAVFAETKRLQAGKSRLGRGLLDTARTLGVAAVLAEPRDPQTEGRPVGEQRDGFAQAYRVIANDGGAIALDSTFLLSVEGSEGRQSFTVASDDGFAKQQTRAWARRISVGYLVSPRAPIGGYYFGAGHEARTSFSGTPTQVCLPLPDLTAATHCRSALLSAPAKRVAQVTHMEVRWYVRDADFALGLKGTYDHTSDEDSRAAIELPLYFLKSSKDMQSALEGDKAALSGGVALGLKQIRGTWQFVASFTVGTVFKLPGL